MLACRFIFHNRLIARFFKNCQPKWKHGLFLKVNLGEKKKKSLYALERISSDDFATKSETRWLYYLHYIHASCFIFSQSYSFCPPIGWRVLCKCTDCDLLTAGTSRWTSDDGGFLLMYFLHKKKPKQTNVLQCRKLYFIVQAYRSALDSLGHCEYALRGGFHLKPKAIEAALQVRTAELTLRWCLYQ